MQKANYQTSWLKLFVLFTSFLGVVVIFNPLFPKSWGVNGGLIAQELIIIGLTLILNQVWVHQPLHFKTDASLGTILGVNFLPILFVILAIAITFVKNNIVNLKSALIVGLCAGITEELVFRGMILPGTMTHFSGHRGMWYAVLISSLIFGMAHMINLTSQPLEATVLQGCNAFFMGIVLAALYLRTRSLIFPMIFHGVNDYIATIAAHGNITMHNESFVPFLGQWVL